MKQEIEIFGRYENPLVRLSKLDSINDVIESGNSYPIANFKFQALGDP